MFPQSDTVGVVTVHGVSFKSFICIKKKLRILFYFSVYFLYFTVQSGLELLSAASRICDLERENAVLKKDLAARVLELHEGEKKLRRTSSNKPSDKCINCEPFSAETLLKSNVKDLLKYYTGFQYDTFTVLFKFLVPDVEKNPLEYKERKSACMKLPLKDQLFLVLCRLRNGFHLKGSCFQVPG